MAAFNPMAKVNVASLGGAALTQKLGVQPAPEELHNTFGSSVLCSAAKVSSKCRANSFDRRDLCLIVAILSGVSACLLVADLFTYGDKLRGSWVCEVFAYLQHQISLSSYVMELTLILATAICMTMRFTTAGRSAKAGANSRCTEFAAMPPRGPQKRADDASNQIGSNYGRTRALWKCKQGLELAARIGDVEKAAALLLEYEKKGGEPESVFYNWLIGACAKRGDTVAAEKWLNRMEHKGIQLTCCSYNTLLGALAKADKPDACDKCLQRMVDAGMEPNVISFGTAIYAHARCGNVAAAEAWFQKMIAAGIPADAVCYNSLSHACAVKGATKDAKRWLEEMESLGMKTCVTTYTAVIGACAKRGDIDYAEFWFARMVGKGVQPNVITFSSMIDACAKAGSLARAEAWHDRMLERGIAPDSHTFAAIINACAKQAGPDGAEAAERWLDRSDQAGMAKDVVYSATVDACGKAGDAERALRVFNRMKASGLKAHIVAYAALARSFAVRGDWIKVESFAQNLAADGIAVNEYFVYAQLLSYAVARPRQVHRAEECFRSALEDGIQANDHVVGALMRTTGRSRCMELMKELCGGRPVPSGSRRPNWESRAR